MALFQPTNITPSDLSGVGTIDALNDLPVTWQVNGTGNTPMTAYQIDIMMNDTESTLLYSTGQVALSDPFYGADAMGNPQYFTATINAAALAAAGVVNSKDNVYKLLITQWWSAGEYVQQSSASVFIARETPSVSITNFSATITTVSYEFLGSYSQAQGDPIEWARWQISGSANNDVLVDTGRIYGVGELKTSYDGFLNGNNYIIRLSGQTVNGAEFDTGWQTFVAEYDIEILDGAMTTCTRKDTDAVQVSFPTPLYTMGAGGGDYEIHQYIYEEEGPSDIVNVNDAVEGPLKSLTVAMTPTQDLHGYANPWPGGGGVNKFGPNTNPLEHSYIGIAGNIATGEAAQGWMVSDYISVKEQTEYTFTPHSTEGYSAKAWFYDTNKTGISYIDSGPQTFTTPADCAYMRFSYRATSYDIQLELGSSVSATYTPYSNLCPIVGHTWATANVNGVNLFDESQLLLATGWALNPDGYYYGARSAYNIAFGGGFPKQPEKYKENTQYTLSCISYNSEATSNTYFDINYTDGTKTSLPMNATTPTGYSVTSTAGKTISYISGTFGSGVNIVAYIKDVQLEESSTASQYKPYTGSTTSVTFGVLGKNYLNMAASTHNSWSFVNIPNTLSPNTQYTFSINGTTTYYYGLYLSDADSTTRALTSNITASESVTFTTPSDMSGEPYLVVAGSTSGAGDEPINSVKPQVELGSSKTAYEPYNETLYQGTYDFISGLLTAEWGVYTADGSEELVEWILNGQTTNIAAAIKLFNGSAYAYYEDGAKNSICDTLPKVSNIEMYNRQKTQGTCVMNNGRIAVQVEGITTLAEMTSWIAANTPTFVYKLKTEKTYQLTPAQINTLLGENNIWSDAGQVTVEYPIDDSSYLSLPTNADSVTWDTAGSAPFSISAPFGFAWRAIIKDVTASLPLVSMPMANGIMNISVSATGASVTISGQTLITATATIADDDDVMLLIEQNAWGLYVNGTIEDSGSLSDWQDEITSIMLYGPQDCLFLWIVDKTFTAQQLSKAESNDPVYDSTTHFLAEFSDGLSAGAIRAQEDVARVTLYRRQAGKVSVQKLATVSPNITAVRDYAALNGNTYTYTLVGETEDGSSTSAISSNSISPCIWNYTLMLCSQDANGFYHVQQEYRFSLDISSGSENNNNNPTLQANFTRYPLRQPNAQNYRSGTLTAFVGKAVNGKYVDSLSEIDALREISTSSLYKFLKNRKGEIMLVDTASPITTTITDKYEKQPVRAAIPWAEIGNAKGKSVITVSGDTYWPNNG